VILNVNQRPVRWQRGIFRVDTDQKALDLAAVHLFLSVAPWSRGMSIEMLERALLHSLCFSLFENQRQIGVARVIRDYATYAYLCDVFILEDYRTQGLGSWMIRCVLDHPDLQELRRIALMTSDAQGFYERLGFGYLIQSDRYMERIQDRSLITLSK
jgi:ribosomal protein S18 acetylase RimI-like enzyme